MEVPPLLLPMEVLPELCKPLKGGVIGGYKPGTSFT